jgi:aryl-alcohol dehydrogenase-like predicted oxidoreductase
VGNAISVYPRKDILLSTAVAKENSKYDDVLKSFDQSLNRLKTDYIDILYHHCSDGTTPISETMKAFLKIQKELGHRY